MKKVSDTRPAADLVLEYELDAPPEKVWRAVSIAEFRERWLPDHDLADAEPVEVIPGEEIRYRMRDEDTPFTESTVTFRMEPDADGGTRLRIIHRLEPTRALHQRPMAANGNQPRMSCAA